ncbi:MAG: enoyl-CoA hydratase-related protein [Desulfuromonadales bacterium]
MAFKNLLLEITRGVAVLTLNRPRVLNAMDQETLDELDRAFSELFADEAVRAIVLTGAGEKSFAAGGDISGLLKLDPLAARRLALQVQKTFAAIEKGPKPVIAAVNGFALGGGCELALCCDIRLASEMASFGQPEINIGILPGFGGSQRLPRLVGKGRAKEMLFTGDRIDAVEAFRIGLVNRVVPADQLLIEARRLAEKMAAKGRVALQLNKQAVENGLEMDFDRACAYEAELFALAFATEDQKEGMSAFLEKRPPRFTDR